MTNGIDPNHPFEPKSRRGPIIAFVGLVFVATIAYLLWRIHAVDAQRKELALAQFRADTANLAGGLEYFFLQRHNDLEIVVESRAVEVYFENTALGVPTRNRLPASLREVESVLARTLDERRVGQSPVFEAFVLLGASGEILAQASAASANATCIGRLPGREFWPDSQTVHDDGFAWVILENPGCPQPSILMAHPVRLKGQEVGQVIARLSFPLLLQAVFKDEEPARQRALFLGYDGRYLFPQTGARLKSPQAFSGLGGDVGFLRSAPEVVAPLRDWTGPCLVAAAPVFGSPLRVFALIPENILLGSPTWPLSLLIALLSLMLLAGFVFIVRSNTERAVLVARYEEQDRSGRELRKRMDEFNTLFNALPGAAFYKDAQGFWVTANSTACAQAGKTLEEIVGKRDHELFPKHLADKIAREDAELLSGQRTSLDTEDVFEYEDRTMIFAKRKVAVVHADGTIGGIIGLSIDMSDKKRVEEELRRSNALQRVIMELAIGFVNIPLEEMDQGILNALTMVGEFAKVDRSYLFAYDFGAKVMNNTHEWCAPGISPEKDNLQGVPTESLPEWVNPHLRNELVHVPDVLAMPAGDPLRRILEAQDIRTLVTLPLVHGSRCFGFVGFDAVRERKTWTETEISLLKILAVLLTNAELRRLHEKDLHEAKGGAEAAYREIEQRIRERTTELAQANAHLHEEMSERLRALRDLNLIQDAISAILIVVDGQGRVFRWSAAAHKAFGLAAADAEGLPFMELPIAWDWESVRHGVEHCRETGTVFKAASVRYDRADGTAAFLVLTVSPLLDEDQVQSGYLVLGEDITEVKMLEARLSQAAKLEAIGQLAAGIAHEINTPTQFVSDSVTFLQDVFESMDRVVVSVEGLCAEAQGGQDSALDRVCPILSEIDMDFVRPEVPRTFERIFDGIQRISSIVQAMNRFSHARSVGKKLVNVNEVIENTLVISRNEWKYVADVETDFEPDLSGVYGLADEIGQVFLNIVVNAAHAIADKVAGTDGKGLISISTRKSGECLEVRIRDTGTGIPEDVGDKVFNLFFTTKELGKGTGQGLPIAYDIVVNKHGGLITFTSEAGIGTTFIIQLPLGGEAVCGLEEDTIA